MATMSDAVATAMTLVNPLDIAQTCSLFGGASLGATTQNVTFLVRNEQGKLPAAQTFTKARWFNGGTVAGNVAVSIWTSDGTTATRIGGTGSIAQATINAAQTADLSAPVIVPAATEWFISFSSDGSGALFLRQTGFTGGNKSASGRVRTGTTASFNATAAQTISALAATTILPWVELS